MLIDTHAHLDFNQFDSDREAVIKRAKEAGINYIINVGSSKEGSARSVELASGHEEIFASVGAHPHDAGGVTDVIFGEICTLARSKKVVAIGEVGLDYYKSPTKPEKQKEIFVKFIELAKELCLPLIIHDREAHGDVIDILKSNCKVPVAGVMHCFSGDEAVLKKALDLGLFISFTCNLTFKNAKRLREIAKIVPVERLLLETDAPFLAPQIYRGQRNEPAYITELRDVLAEILGLSKDEVERITTENAKKLFKI